MIELSDVIARVVPVTTRLPFRYGIAEMTAAPHVVIEVRVVRHGIEVKGWSSEQLPPKWFTKDPTTTFADDLVGLVGAVEHALDSATGLRGDTTFDLWRTLDDRQMSWARRECVPGLLAGLGTALVERAIIDAVCRLEGVSFAKALHDGVLGFAPGQLHPELATVQWREHLAAEPAPSMAVRHTVGFADALTDEEVIDRPDDDLPVSLEEVLRVDAVHHLKVKTAGDADADLRRLTGVFAVCDRFGVKPQLTIDGNESMREAVDLRRWTARLLESDLGPRLRESLIAIEQPVHRDAAFSAELGGVLADLSDHGVAVIVDESDSDASAVRRALDLGYAGGTYKGCKGVFRGLANAVLVAHRSDRDGRRRLMTAEDLTTLPPLTVAQDLVVAAIMGLTHIERNGHHYFGRLAPLAPGIAEEALRSHPDLYRADAQVGARLRVRAGSLVFASALAAPFGYTPTLDVEALPALSLDMARAAI